MSDAALFHTFTTTDGQSISVTAAHFIKTSIPSSVDSDTTVAFLQASKITLDHRLFVSGNISPIAIAKITISPRIGLYSPWTLSGTLLVNNISAFCYTAVYGLTHEISHKYLQLFMMYYRFTRWMFGQSYHPFAVENFRQGCHPLITFSYANC